MTVTVAFIGLGVMGRPMAKNLLKTGYQVIAYRRQGVGDADFESAGGSTARTVAEAVAGADAIITMLPDSPQILEVVEGEGGVFSNAPSGSLFIDMSTISPQVARQLHDLGMQRGIRVLDAPVSGGEAGAIEGVLSIMVGAEPADFITAKPILEAMGRTITRLGGPGAGQTVKAANQLIVAAHIQALAEVIVFLEASGVDARLALEALGGGLAGSAILERKGSAMLARQYKPGFRTDLHHKDLAILAEAARAVGVPLPIGSAVTQLIAAVKSMGGGELDHSALLALAELTSANHQDRRQGHILLNQPVRSGGRPD